MRTTESEWKWYGNATHLIVGQWCRFHMATEIGGFLVSTVGEYVPDEGTREILARSRGVTLEGKGDARLHDYMTKVGFETIGYRRKYETMVFKITGRCDADGCHCGVPQHTGEDIDSGGYNDAKAAREGHMAMCEKYASGVAVEVGG